MKILVVDAVTASRVLTGRLLNLAGYDDTILLDDTSQVITTLNEQTVDFIIINNDIANPTAAELIELIRKNPSSAETSLLIGLSETHLNQVTELLKLGASGYIIQPYSHQALLEKIQSIIND